jgi:hypothetical protein
MIHKHIFMYKFGDPTKRPQLLRQIKERSDRELEDAHADLHTQLRNAGPHEDTTLIGYLMDHIQSEADSRSRENVHINRWDDE